jgi:hypothetical protein
VLPAPVVNCTLDHAELMYEEYVELGTTIICWNGAGVAALCELVSVIGT